VIEMVKAAGRGSIVVGSCSTASYWRRQLISLQMGHHFKDEQALDNCSEEAGTYRFGMNLFGCTVAAD